MFSKYRMLTIVCSICKIESHKLSQLSVSQGNLKKKLGNIYGSAQNKVYLTLVIPILLMHNLKDDWEILAPSFHSWFCKTCLPSFRQFTNNNIDQQVEDSQFFNKRPEVLHKLQKKVNQCNVWNNVCSINESMQNWVASYFKEAIIALYVHGKYWLAIGYEHCFCYAS